MQKQNGETLKISELIQSSATLLLILTLSACGSISDNENDTNGNTDESPNLAVIQSTGDGSEIEFTNGVDKIESGFIPQVETDYAVFANGKYFYQLGKYDIDRIQKYHIDNPELGFYPNDGFILRLSGTTTSSNPHNMVFLNDANNTAVITRYGHAKSWVVNLNAQDFDDFLIAELDLSHHADPTSEADSDPEANMVFFKDNKLFITLQNLDGYSATENAKVVVFDVTTWLEIDTDPDTSGVQAISLNLKNHQSGVINGNNIYLGSLVYAAWNSGDPNTGGIESINTESYAVTTLMDDLAISKITADNSGNVFFSDYTSWQNNSLYILNSDNSYNLVSNELSGINITLLASPGNSIWLGTNSFDSTGDETNNNQIIRLDNLLDYSTPKLLEDITLSNIETALKPISIAFFN